MPEDRKQPSAQRRRQTDTGRSDRLLPALNNGYFQPDELSFENLLQLSRDIAAQLNFYDLQGQQSGQWNTLFDHSEVAVIAAILSVQCSHEQQLFQAEQARGLSFALEKVLSLYQQLDTWLQRLFKADTRSAGELRLKLTSVVEKQLAQHMIRLAELILAAPSDELSPVVANQLFRHFDTLDTLWGIRTDQGKLIILRPELQASGEPMLNASKDSNQPPDYWQNINESLQLCFSAAMNAIEFLQTDCQSSLDQSLAKADHAPALGLFLAFLRLLGNVRLKLNRFTERHLDFYYRDLLQFSTLPAVPPAVYLKLSRDIPAVQSETSASLPAVAVGKGFPFTCGQDEQLNDIVYHSEQSVMVTDARVAQVCSLYLKRDRLISPERELHYVTAIQGDVMLPVTDDISADMQAAGNMSSASLFDDADSLNIKSGGGISHKGIRVFGETPETHGSRVHTATGIAFSDPVLLLKEGLRQVSIRISLGEFRHGRMQQLIYMIREAVPEQQKAGLADLFAELLQAEPDMQSALTACTGIHPKDSGIALSQCLPDDGIQQLLNADKHSLTGLLYKCFLLAMTELLAQAKSKAADQSKTAELFFRLMGRLFSRHTLSGANWLTEQEISQIKARSQQLLNSQSAARICRLLDNSPLATFYELYSELFNIRISTEEGWLSVNDYRLHPLDHHEAGPYGFRLDFTLGQSAPALVACDPTIHGDLWQFDEPAVRLEIRPQAAFFPYSVFRSFTLNQLDIETRVDNVTDLQIYNSEGQADPSQPFAPFGSQPGQQSWCVLGNYEAARKPLTELRLRIHWADLPALSDGFTEYYQGYETAYSNDSFRIMLETLKDGEWKNTVATQGVPMFRTHADSGRLSECSGYIAGVSGKFKPVRHTLREDQFHYNIRSRDGLFRLTLADPVSGFGHHEYAPLLSKRLLENARTKKQQPLPALPYTPTVSRLALGYTARSRISLNGKHPRRDVRILHLHPFGYEQIWPIAGQQNRYQPVCFFPRYAGDGNLFIGIEASELQGQINLFFRMDDSTRLTSQPDSDQLQWFFLTGNRWQRLNSQQIISDSTHGFMTSGIITLDLPAGLDRSHTVMPDGLFWLRVSSLQGLEHPGNCLTVATHVVKATMALQQTAALSASDELQIEQMAREGDWQPARKISGLAPAVTMDYEAGNSRIEQEPEFRERVSERLRHKGRAVTPWDYERLILQHFPGIDRVRCFCGVRFDQTGSFPGHILIIVRKKVMDCAHSACGSHRISTRLLVQIKAFLQSVSSPFVSIDVRNPEYERVQVRCTVTFQPDEHHGLALRRLNQALCEYLCPWQHTGMNQGFGWQPEVRQIESFISHQSYVSYVTDFSVLQISQQDISSNTWQLNDSAVLTETEVQARLSSHRNSESESIRDTLSAQALVAENNLSERNVLSTLHPWHLLMPVARHYLIVQPEPVAMTACKTGVGELEVGDNFILS
ncbi:hypothetical protein [Oceanospirillum sediminis]|uniref:Baseplate protein J-like domain-containing protein n=1 Tax=Oceanospirillum sediminis TaxID=2760088 RepID=A0A839IRU8_9GAMM|nr:hypothetical protein [Oceanospirillum sediminis]MBB1487167.1 hypothetical protein [Oceanospirillum sediminis]